MSLRQGAEIGIELDPNLNALLPKGVSFSSSHTYPLQRRYDMARASSSASWSNSECVPTTSQDTFQSADLTPAGERPVTRYLSPGGRATLDIGPARHGRTGAGDAAGRGFRPSYLSARRVGSGKTFALGVILERLLLETDLRIVILDPNSDFVSLDRIRSLADVNRTSSRELSPEEYAKVLQRYAGRAETEDYASGTVRQGPLQPPAR